MSLGPEVALDETPLPTVNPEVLRRAVDLFAPLCRYHRLEVRGFDRLPEGPALLVGNHNAGLNPADGLFLVHYYRRYGFNAPIYCLGHDALFSVPGLSSRLADVGVVRARRRDAARLLEAGHKVLVFPGGDIENLRPFRDRKRVNLAGRTGFVRLARRTGVPIVPVVSAGGHENLVVLTQGKQLARRIGMDRFKIHSFPVLLAMPWGLVWGPKLLLPYFPLPSKIAVEIGEPIASAEPDARTPAAERMAVYARVHERMQTLLDGLYAERRWPVFG